MERRDLMVNLRVNADEMEALKELAERDVQTAAGWLRKKLYAEAVAAGLLRRPYERARPEVIHAENHE